MHGQNSLGDTHDNEDQRAKYTRKGQIEEEVFIDGHGEVECHVQREHDKNRVNCVCQLQTSKKSCEKNFFKGQVKLAF